MAGLVIQGRRPVVVGANHRSSSLTLRDRLFVDDAEMPAFLDGLRRKGFDQAVVLSTCDRVEVQALHGEPEHAARTLHETLEERAEGLGESIAEQLYTMVDEAALRQIFRVAASLDSMVLGEPQVLGQVKAGHRMAAGAGLAGPALETVLQAAYGAAKRIRTETAIGERAVSIAAAAGELARDLLGDLSEAVCLMLGGGEMGEMVGRELLSHGLGRLTVADPLESRAAALARRLDCHRGAFGETARLMAEADIVIAAVGGRRPTIEVDHVRQSLKARKRRPQLLVDAGIPGDVDPAVNRLDDAFLYDLGDLERVAYEGLRQREREAEAAEAIIDDELRHFLRDRAERRAVPAITDLRQHMEEVRADVLAEAGGDAERATQLLVNRLLHGPQEALRDAAAAGGGENLETAVRRLFGLAPSARREDE